jgi:hypothetical protein
VKALLKIKTPKPIGLGVYTYAICSMALPSFIPTLTVGTGISPVQSVQKTESRAFTAGGDLHPAPKAINNFCL